ncbi:hypothetical protein F2Q68_00004843 [Brassica cretica]|uniref:Uncharacterized protein n=1 Tax=Brassica cretica TaxID=69181 RepID=A0A8S9J6Y7_BRACR|nr:hypothetical protein F2Q68_00004843 [Brassica cretica]
MNLVLTLVLDVFGLTTLTGSYFLGFPEKYPQPVGKVSLLEWLVQGYPENSFGEAIHLLLINSSLEMLRNLFLSFPQGHRWSSIDVRLLDMEGFGWMRVISCKLLALHPHDHLSYDLLHYADDPPGHADFQSRPELELVSQPCFVAQYRSMSEAECQLMPGGHGRSTEE